MDKIGKSSGVLEHIGGNLAETIENSGINSVMQTGEGIGKSLEKTTTEIFDTKIMKADFVNSSLAPLSNISTELSRDGLKGIIATQLPSRLVEGLNLKFGQ